MHPHIEAQEHLIRAEDAEKRAVRSVDPEMRATYLEIAEQYRRLAKEAAER
jgi:hypothetical protein